MIETRPTRSRRRIERRRRRLVFLAAVVLLVVAIAAAATGLFWDGSHGSGHGNVATAGTDPGHPTTTVTTMPSSTTTGAGSSGGAVARSPGSSPTAPATAEGQAARSGPCAYAACVSLQATETTGAVNHAGSGLNELPNSVANSSDMADLATTMYRSIPGYQAGRYNWTAWDAAVAAGAKTTLLLSDLWLTHSGQSRPPTAWSNWNNYNTWVKATVASIVASGQEVDYWDVYNEPGWYGYYSPADFANVTPDDLLEQFLYTYQDIKSIDPSAQIIGPSVGIMTFTPIPTNSSTWTDWHQFDMTTFLDFCAQHGLQLAAVAWHEDGAGPQQIQLWATQAWALIRSLPALGHPVMYLDEYAAKPMQPVPGWDVGYLAAIANGSIAYSVRSCWDSCSPDTLDGLLLSSGATTSGWFERRTYAQMTGEMISTSSTNSSVPALGSITPGRVVALIGRDSGCGSPAYWCNEYPFPWFARSGPESVGVSVVLPWTTTGMSIQLSHVSSEPGRSVSGPTADSPAGIHLYADGPGRELLTFYIPSFADGDAYSLVVSAG